MPLFERFKTVVDGRQPRTYSYECRGCGTQFESPEVNPNFADCPDCDEGRALSLP